MTQNTLRKTVNVFLVTLIAFGALHLGDQLGWVNAKAWVDLSPDGDLQSALLVGLLILLFVFGEELKLTNNLDANGRAIENDERARRAADRSILLVLAAFVVAKLLFEVMVFVGGMFGG